MNASNASKVLKELNEFAALVNDINKNVEEMMQAPVSSILNDDSSNQTFKQLIDEADKSCPPEQEQDGGRRSPKVKRGGAAAAVTKKCIKASVILTLASIFFLLIKISEIDRVNCFAWYTPLASLLRSPIQNTYCNMLRSANDTVYNLIQKGINANDIPKLIAAVSAFASVSTLTYSTVVRFVNTFDSSINVLVDYVFKEKTSTEAVSAVRNIMNSATRNTKKKTVAKKDESNNNSEPQDEPQDGGKKVVRRKVSKVAKTNGKKTK